MKIRALPKRLLVTMMERGERQLSSGIILADDDGRADGIRGRWAQVYKIGEGIDTLKVGDWVFLEHGRWSRGLSLYDRANDKKFTIYRADWPEGVLAYSEEDPRGG